MTTDTATLSGAGRGGVETSREKEFYKQLPRTTLGTGLARAGTNTGTPREPPKRQKERKHVWCLLAPSRGGVPLLGETRSAELTLGDPCYGPATAHPPLGVRAL